MNQQKTGKFLKYLRKGKGLTQEQLRRNLSRGFSAQKKVFSILAVNNA